MWWLTPTQSGQRFSLHLLPPPIKTIEMLSHLFAAYGLPEEIVSDNGLQLVSDEMLHFMNKHGLQHTRVPCYHPASNGEAERYVQILKQPLRTSKISLGNHFSCGCLVFCSRTEVPLTLSLVRPLLSCS